jgi:hypothetical protein
MEKEVLFAVSDFTRRLVADPLCSFFFLHPADFGSDAMNEEYRQAVKRPMDMTRIQKNLKDPDYKFESWVSDFSQIFTNAITFNGPASYVTGIAQAYKRKLDKFVARVVRKSDAAYAMALGTAYAAYLEVLARGPAAPRAGVVPVDQITGPFADYALNLLARRLNRIATPEMATDFRRIVPGAVEKTKGEIEVDVGTLSADEVKALWDYVRRKEAE